MHKRAMEKTERAELSAILMGGLIAAAIDIVAAAIISTADCGVTPEKMWSFSDNAGAVSQRPRHDTFFTVTSVAG